IRAFQPCRRQASMISSESVAMITSERSGDERTASYTQPTSGLPTISRSILRGRRVDANRAGITATDLMIGGERGRNYGAFGGYLLSCNRGGYPPPPVYWNQRLSGKMRNYL